MKISEWLYFKLIAYYAAATGVDLEDKEGNKRDLDFKNFMGDGFDSDLPLFLNRGFIAFGNVSIMRTKRKLRRGVQEWAREDLEQIEIGPRELHESEVPVITLEKVICTPLDEESVPAAIVVTRVFKNKSQLLFEESTRFVFRKVTQGITYLERMRESDGDSSIVFEELFRKSDINYRTDFVTLKFTLVLPDKREEDFEFEVYALAKSFYVKAVNYVDFFDRRFVLVIKNLKLHENCTYDQLTEAFDRQSVFVDDFNSSRIKMPVFSPPLYPVLNRALLSGRLQDTFSEDFLSVEDIEDEYVNKFYRVVFAQMRYDLIENNFVKAKLPIKAWWDFAQTLKPSAEILSLLNYNPAFNDFGRFRESLSAVICPEDRRGFSDLLSVAILGIKSEVRQIFWEKISAKDGKYKVSETLAQFTPKIVEQLYKMVNEKNIYEVRCVLRNHQRIVTHYMKLLEEVAEAHADEARQPQHHALPRQRSRARGAHGARVLQQGPLLPLHQRHLAALLADERDALRQGHRHGLLPARVRRADAGTSARSSCSKSCWPTRSRTSWGTCSTSASRSR